MTRPIPPKPGMPNGAKRIGPPPHGPRPPCPCPHRPPPPGFMGHHPRIPPLCHPHRHWPVMPHDGLGIRRIVYSREFGDQKEFRYIVDRFGRRDVLAKGWIPTNECEGNGIPLPGPQPWSGGEGMDLPNYLWSKNVWGW